VVLIANVLLSSRCDCTYTTLFSSNPFYSLSFVGVSERQP
jgi:hypothetical protein